MKRFIALFLVFSILALSGNLYAKERKGADLIIQKMDGQQVRGELIAVKENLLVLLERESGGDVSVDVDDIIEITIVKKGNYGKGFIGGLIAGEVLFGGLVALTAAAGELDVSGGGIILAALVCGLAGGAFGALYSGLLSFDETIQIAGKSDSEIQKVLKKLRKKARVRNSQ